MFEHFANCSFGYVAQKSKGHPRGNNHRIHQIVGILLVPRRLLPMLPMLPMLRRPTLTVLIGAPKFDRHILMKGPASCNTTTSSIQRKPANIEILCNQMAGRER